MIDLRKYELGKVERTVFYMVLGLVSAAVAMLLYRNLLFAMVIIPFASKIKSYVIDAIIDRRRQDYMVQFKDFLFMASTAIGAGRSMKDAIGETIPGLREIHGEQSILAGELGKAHERMEIGGENDVDVLMDLATSSGMEDCVDFVTIYSICKSTGASLILALNKAASVIIEKMTIEREIRELVKRKKREGMVIFVMPIIVLLFMNICAADYVAPLYTTWAGRIIMTVVLAANIGIYGMIRKITDVQI